MTLYFKTAYKPFFEEWKTQRGSSSVFPSLVNFAKHEFPGLLEALSK